MFGKDASTFGSFNVAEKTISGTANKIESYTGFSHDSNQQTGYYLPLNVENWEGCKINTNNSEGRPYNFKDDGDMVVYLGKEDITVTYIKLTPKDGDPVQYTVSITKAEAA